VARQQTHAMAASRSGRKTAVRYAFAELLVVVAQPGRVTRMYRTSSGTPGTLTQPSAQSPRSPPGPRTPSAGMAHWRRSSASYREQQERGSRRVRTICSQRDLDAVRSAHAGVHDERVAQREGLTRCDGRRPDGRIGRSTALQHLHLRWSRELYWPRAGVDELETSLGRHVEGHVAQVQRRSPCYQSAGLDAIRCRRRASRGGTGARGQRQRAERRHARSQPIDSRAYTHKLQASLAGSTVLAVKGRDHTYRGSSRRAHRGRLEVRVSLRIVRIRHTPGDEV
jgi:hypothetical protein